MNENNGGSSSLPPFLTKTYEMINDSSSDSIISWSDNNKSFIVKNPMEFSRDLLPKFFKHKNFSSFIRQLNTYGFRKIDSEKWEFANDDFVRDQPYLMKNIHRRKPVHSHSLLNLQSHNPLTESERQNMKEQIERLRKEKEVYLAELKNQELERKGFDLQVKTLKDRIQQMEKHQDSIVTFASKGLSLNLEAHHSRKRRFFRKGLQENTIVDPLNRSQVEKLESWLMFWENLVMECDKSDVESSSIDLDGAESSLSIGETRQKCLRIDMKSEADTVTVMGPKEGFNNVFWGKLLTEDPGPIEQQEVESERKDIDERNGDLDNALN